MGFLVEPDQVVNVRVHLAKLQDRLDLVAGPDLLHLLADLGPGGGKRAGRR
jgi:hypothetical protein